MPRKKKIPTTPTATPVNAFRAEDGSLWDSEAEALSASALSILQQVGRAWVEQEACYGEIDAQKVSELFDNPTDPDNLRVLEAVAAWVNARGVAGQ